MTRAVAILYPAAQDPSVGPLSPWVCLDGLGYITPSHQYVIRYA